MSTKNLQMQVQAAEIIAEYTFNELEKFKSDLMYELLGIRSIKQFNNIPYNTVIIVNGKVIYNEDVIKELFIGFMSGTYDEIQTGGFSGFIKSFFQTIKNLRIIRYSNKLDKENRRIYNLYISPNGDKNIFKALSKIKDDFLIQLNDTDEEDIEYQGGLENYIKKYIPLDSITSSLTKDMEPTKKIIERLNALK